MKRLLALAIVTVVGSGALYAGAFEKKYEMMDSRIHSKMEKYKGNSMAQEFLAKKLACVKTSKSVKDLKVCKKTYHPKALKKLVK
jgi:hypothetical protein